MRFFFRLGVISERFLRSLVLFFDFLGHWAIAMRNVILRRNKISWLTVHKILDYSGARMVLPLSIISGLVAISAATSARALLARYNLQQQALWIAHSILLDEVLPIFIGLVLCIQTALNTIHVRGRIVRFGRTEAAVMYEDVLPTSIGMILTALLLYVYLFAVMFVGLYFTFHYLQGTSLNDYLAHLQNSFSLSLYVDSLLKTLFFALIGSIGAGFYYYHVSRYHLPSRSAVSRILTRSIFWLIVSSALLSFMGV